MNEHTNADEESNAVCVHAGLDATPDHLPDALGRGGRVLASWAASREEQDLELCHFFRCWCVTLGVCCGSCMCACFLQALSQAQHCSSVLVES